MTMIPYKQGMGLAETVSTGSTFRLPDITSPQAISDYTNKSAPSNSTLPFSPAASAEDRGALAVNYLDNQGIKSDQGFDWKGALGDKHMMGNIAGLAGTVMQAIAMPTMLENARLQNKSLRHNLATAKEEQQRRNRNIKSFNTARVSALA